MQNRLVPSLCPYCATGCGLIYQVEQGKLTATLPNLSYPVNRGALCIKGWNSHEHIVSPKRLQKPLLREAKNLREIGLEEAVSVVAARLKEIIARHGPQSVAMLASGKATNEENYLAQKFMRTVVGSNNIDHCARL
jgi:predicted molibdopterin-dependent oxidoreductase YjgC